MATTVGTHPMSSRSDRTVATTTAHSRASPSGDTQHPPPPSSRSDANWSSTSASNYHDDRAPRTATAAAHTCANPRSVAATGNGSGTGSGSATGSGGDASGSDSAGSAAQSCNLHVSGLALSVDDAALAAAFAPFGTILSAKVMLRITTGVSRGFGFVLFDTPAHAAAARVAMQGATLDGGRLCVTFSKHRGEHVTIDSCTVYMRNVPNAVGASPRFLAYLRSFGHVERAGRKSAGTFAVTFVTACCARACVDATHGKRVFSECVVSVLAKLEEPHALREERLRPSQDPPIPHGGTATTQRPFRQDRALGRIKSDPSRAEPVEALVPTSPHAAVRTSPPPPPPPAPPQVPSSSADPTLPWARGGGSTYGFILPFPPPPPLAFPPSLSPMMPPFFSGAFGGAPPSLPPGMVGGGGFMWPTAVGHMPGGFAPHAAMPPPPMGQRPF